MTSQPDPPGREPRESTRRLEAAAAELTPAHSLARIESTARGVIAAVAALGAVVTGFGALGAADLVSNRWAIVPAVVVGAIALALAGAALVPSRATVRTGNLDAVAEHLRDQVRRRGPLAQLAVVALAVGYMAALLPVLLIEPERKPPIVEVTWSGSENEPVVQIQVGVREPPNDAVGATLTVTELAPKERRLAEFHQKPSAPPAEVAFSASLKPSRGATRVRIEFSTRGLERDVRKVVDVKRP